MSEKYIALNSFKYGLDARREFLSSLPGTLAQLNNAHINAGGEIEQRMSFVKDAVLFTSDTFGLQDTDSGIMVFGTVSPPVTPLPTGVVYQQLVPPAGVGGTISRIVYSCNYLGKAFVIVIFDNSTTNFFFYDGTLVGDSRNGIVLPGTGLGGLVEPVTELATDLAAQVILIDDWLANANHAVIGGTVTAKNGSVIVMSPVGIHFTPTPSVNSAAGYLIATLVDQNKAAIVAKAASTAFTLNVGTNGTVTLTAPATAAGTGTLQISGGAVPFNSTLAQTALDIISLVNLYTGQTGYYASTGGAGTVNVFAPASFGNVTFNLTVVTTGDITTIAGPVPPPLPVIGLTLNPANLTVVRRAQTPHGQVSGTMSASVTGASGPVTLNWSEVDSQGNDILPGSTNASGIHFTSTTAATVGFNADVIQGNSVVGHFRCTASATNGSKTLFFTVKLTLAKPF